MYKKVLIYRKSPVNSPIKKVAFTLFYTNLISESRYYFVYFRNVSSKKISYKGEYFRTYFSS